MSEISINNKVQFLFVSRVRVFLCLLIHIAFAGRGVAECGVPCETLLPHVYVAGMVQQPAEEHGL